ncbi:hypothetical protein R1flu_011894 [Riccia fluitans]|uniref:Uncharacterized protein n=1 Tax=Riccia fluitans TaxID=41844 RepID=A0ABD1Z931_9MARC
MTSILILHTSLMSSGRSYIHGVSYSSKTRRLDMIHSLTRMIQMETADSDDSSTKANGSRQCSICKVQSGNEWKIRSVLEVPVRDII